MSKIVNSKPLTDVLPEKFKFLAENGPCVKLNGNADNIEILSTPAEFNDRLCELAVNSKRKIGLATLYMDNSEKSLRLINSCEKALTNNDQLQCNFLGDYPRGCRGEDSTRQVCLPLKKKFPQRTRISLYHTPYLRGFWKMILPKKLDETIGVQHSKLYLFDDDVVMSGANLSHIYFTNRQDRYIHFKNQPVLVELLWKIFRAIQKLSIEVDENDQEYFNSLDPQNSSLELWQKQAQELFDPILKSRPTISNLTGNDILIFPTLQASQLGIKHDSKTMMRLLSEGAFGGAPLFISTAYFNMEESMKLSLMSCKNNFVSLLIANEKANGFYKAKFPLGLVPEIYKFLTVQFHNLLEKSKMSSFFHLVEYHRQNWTFHGKGLWYFKENPNNNTENIACTIIGSSNYGLRSINRDTEVQLLVLGVGENEALSRKLKMEKDNLWNDKHTSEIDSGSREEMKASLPKFISQITWLLREYF